MVGGRERGKSWRQSGSAAHARESINTYTCSVAHLLAVAAHLHADGHPPPLLLPNALTVALAGNRMFPTSLPVMLQWAEPVGLPHLRIGEARRRVIVRVGY